MKILSLDIHNILSFEKASIDFADSGLVLVEGWNYDDGRANGAGKTAIFNALAFGLYDQLPRKITKSEIVKRGTKSGGVSVKLKVGDDVYTVERQRPNAVHFFKDGKPIDMTQDEFEKKIKLSYEQFLVSMYTAQSSPNKFMLLNDTDKKEFLLRLMSLEEIALCKKEADDLVKAIFKELQEINLVSQKAISRVEAYRESVVDVEEMTRIMEIDRADIVAMMQLIGRDQQVQKPNLAKFIKLEEDLEHRLQSISEARTLRGILFSQYQKLDKVKNKSFTMADECSYCGQSVDTSNAKHIHTSEIAKAAEEMKELKAKIDSCDSVIQKEVNLQELLRKTREKKSKETQEYDTALLNIMGMKDSIKLKNTRIDNTQKQINANDELLHKIELLDKEIKDLSSKASQKSMLMAVYESVAQVCSPTGAPAYVLDSMVDSFNDLVTENIKLIWPNASYKLNTYKENSKGNIVAKFSEELMLNGIQVSIGSMSGGEVRSLSLAVDFAVIGLLSRQFGISLNPIIMDEPFEGLDAAGREIVIELLEKLAVDRQIIVIDHMSEAKAMFTNVWRVEKRDGESELVI